ncbi:hypothetical protein J6590_024170, partial [Homalodisca vitripennis]
SEEVQFEPLKDVYKGGLRMFQQFPDPWSVFYDCRTADPRRQCTTDPSFHS